MTSGEYHRNWYHRNKKRIQARKEEQRKRFRDKVNEFIRTAKDVPCADCGVKYPSYVMDFDHRGEKEFNIANSRSLGVIRLAQEISKCDVVCANCHRERTFGK